MDSIESKYLNKIVRNNITGENFEVVRFAGDVFMLVVPNEMYDDNFGLSVDFEDLEKNFTIIS